MSTNSNSADFGMWKTSKLIPSVVFVLTPLVAVGLLVAWSLRLQNNRRRFLATFGPNRGALHGGESGIDPSQAPIINEIWLENYNAYYLEEDEHFTSEKRMSLPPSKPNVITDYTFKDVMPISLNPIPSPKQTSFQVSMVVRMPSKSSMLVSPHGYIRSAAVSDMDILLGTCTTITATTINASLPSPPPSSLPRIPT